MLLEDAKLIKKDFAQFEPLVCQDFQGVDNYYVGVYSNRDDSQYLIKGAMNRLYIVAVGLGDYGIGFKTLLLHISELKAHLRKVK